VNIINIFIYVHTFLVLSQWLMTEVVGLRFKFPDRQTVIGILTNALAVMFLAA